MSIPAATYSLLMFFTGGFLMWWFGKRKDEVIVEKMDIASAVPVSK